MLFCTVQKWKNINQFDDWDDRKDYEKIKACKKGKVNLELCSLVAINCYWLVDAIINYCGSSRIIIDQKKTKRTGIMWN